MNDDFVKTQVMDMPQELARDDLQRLQEHKHLQSVDTNEHEAVERENLTPSFSYLT